MPAPTIASRSIAFATLLVLVASEAEAQSTPLTGFTTAASQREAALEQWIVKQGDTALSRRHSYLLTREPHVAGTPAQQATARYVLSQMRSYGLDTMSADLEVYIPYPDSTVVEFTGPGGRRLDLDEPALPEDSVSQRSVWRTMAGLGGEGDATGQLVYVNYGLPDDYEMLDSLGVSVKGKVVIARYGRSYRGIKVREAEKHGAVAILLYSDPFDDGYVVGDVYPEGPMRHPRAVQRGSVRPLTGADPGSPDWPSLPGARRLDPGEMKLARIPVVPLGYENAALLLKPLRGPGAPRGWQGGLPFRYHIGNGEITARVAVWLEPPARRWKRVTNTFGIIKGSTWPDELVILGGHRDAWGPGAVDNVSGVTSILEAARILGAAAKEGRRPARTLMFATWDAEEWGIIGSSEWAEWKAPELTVNAVAYLNLDVSAVGSEFGAAGTASLHPLLRDLTRLVDQPYGTGSTYDAWRKRTRPAGNQDVRLGDLGGGSDFAGFYNHLGIPSAGFGYGGPYGVYHSAYDSYDWMRRFGDTAYVAHAAAGELAALFLARMGNADLVPFDYHALAQHLRRAAVAFGGHDRGPKLELTLLKELTGAISRFDTAAVAWAQARDAALQRGVNGMAIVQANAEIRKVERELTRPEGLRGRPWYRNLVFASDRDNGYADIALPSIAEAIADGDDALAAQEVKDFIRRLDAAAGRLRAATERVNRR